MSQRNFLENILVPLEWITDPGRTLHGAAIENWFATPPSQLGLIRGSHWKVVENDQIQTRNLARIDREISLFNGSGRYVLIASNNAEIIKKIQENPKLPYIHRKEIFEIVKKSEFDEKNYQFKFLMRDWVGGLWSPDGDVWIVKESIIERVKKFLWPK